MTIVTDPVLLWDDRHVPTLPVISRKTDTGGMYVMFPLGFDGVAVFEKGMERAQRMGLPIPFVAATRLGVYLPEGFRP